MRDSVLCRLGPAIMALLPCAAFADMADAVDRAKSGQFVASGDVACAQNPGEALGTCSAEVARDDDDAAVVITFRNGFVRILMFEDSAFLRGNTTMSGVGTDTEWELAEGIHHIRVDDQRFEIPETLVVGE